MDKLIYAKNSNDRADCFNIITEIITRDNKKFVVKKPFGFKSIPHVLDLPIIGENLKDVYTSSKFEVNQCYKTGNHVECEYVEAETLEEILDNLLARKKIDEFQKIIDEYILEIRKIYDKDLFKLTDDFIEVFGNVNLSRSLRSSSYVNIDMVFSNVFLMDSKWVVIDYEWSFSFPIPTNYVIYRVIFYYYHNHPNRSILSDENIMESYGITKEEIIQYQKMENHFVANYVHGKKADIFQIYNIMGRQRISVDSLLEAYGKEKLMLQIYCDYGKGFSEEGSIFVEPKKLNENSYEVEINIPVNTKNIRIDPGNAPCMLSIVDILQMVQDYGYRTDFSSNSVIEEEGLLFFATNDPHITLSDLRPDARKIFLRLDYIPYGAELSRAVAKYSGSGKYKNELRRQYKKELDALREKNSINESIIEESKRAVEERDDRYADITNSTSWRITAPLRFISETLRKNSFFRKGGRLVKSAIRGDLKGAKLRAQVEEEYHLLEAEYENCIYQNWIVANENENVDFTDLKLQPLISIITPVYNAEDNHLIECIESVIHQTYDNWELILVDDKSTKPSMRRIIEDYSQHEKVSAVFRAENGHISKTTNDGIEASKGEYIAFLDCDDTLNLNALYHVVSKINENPSYEFIYSDEDKLSADGKNRFDPYFKPEWSPDLLMSCNYINHFSVYKAKIVKKLGGLRSQYDGAQDHDLILRASEVIKSENIGHIPKILYHWRVSEHSTALDIENKGYVFEAMRGVKEEALKRRGLKGNLIFDNETSQYIVEYCHPSTPLVSIVMLSKDNVEMFRKCVRSIQENTLYSNIEILVVDNGSNEKNKIEMSEFCKENHIEYLYQAMDFNFSRMCNIGAAASNGEFVLFLNDDVEVIQSNWIDILLGQASLPYAGAVGAKLLYPNSDLIQHTGIISIDQGPSHALLKKSDNKIICNSRNRFNYNYLAVTGACLLIEKEKFVSVEGYDENLPIGYNDVNLCLKLKEKGYYNVVRSDVTCYHHESVSRGDDSRDPEKLKRLIGEKQQLYTRFPKYKDNDPFVNENYSRDSVYFNINDSGTMSAANILNDDFGSLSALPFVNAVLDSITIGEDSIAIAGWSVANIEVDLLYKKQIILELKDQTYLAVETRKRIREDLVGHFGKYSKYSGFICELDKKYLETINREKSIYLLGEHNRNRRLQRFDNIEWGE